MTTDPTKKWISGPWSVDGEGLKAIVRSSDGYIVAVRHRLPGAIHEANAHLIAAAPDLAEVAEFYADPANFIIMDDLWYEFDEANVDLTRYAPIGTKAQKALAKARGET